MCTDDPRADDRERRMRYERRIFEDDVHAARVASRVYDAAKEEMRAGNMRRAAAILERCEAVLRQMGVRADEYRHLAMYRMQCREHEALRKAEGEGRSERRASPKSRASAHRVLRRVLPHVDEATVARYASSLAHAGLDCEAAFAAMSSDVLDVVLRERCGVRRGHAAALVEALGVRPNPCEWIVSALERLMPGVKGVQPMKRGKGEADGEGVEEEEGDE